MNVEVRCLYQTALLSILSQANNLPFGRLVGHALGLFFSPWIRSLGSGLHAGYIGHTKRHSFSSNAALEEECAEEDCLGKTVWGSDKAKGLEDVFMNAK